MDRPPEPPLFEGKSADWSFCSQNGVVSRADPQGLTLGDVDYRGILIADHVPTMVGDSKTGWAYSIGYIKALYDMARDERRG